ncbi:MAG: tyrosine--tRNA ligase [Alphaproteobacteria bacterium]|jgi:tyrosyl-tRNA synthetase
MSNNRIDHILLNFDRTSEQFFSKDEFRAKLRSGKKLRIKYGVDVTAPTLHIGHAVNLWLMRYLQSMGHKVVFLIGDFTTRIGDPDGRLDTRPIIPREEIDKNAEEFIQQAKMVLRFDDPELIEVRRNSEWYDKMGTDEFLRLASMVTHARLISRDMFQLRIDSGREIYMHEILYPVLQGYDSVMVESDLTIIGSDQLFNEMMGRFFQEKFDQKPQTIITTKITQGIDNKHKQSKSLGNYIGLAHSPRDKFGRVMSIPDALIGEYFRVYTDVPLEEVDRICEQIAHSPREAKVKLAYAIVGRYHGHEAAVLEREWFEKTVSKGLAPDDIPTLAFLQPQQELLDVVVMARSGKSKSDSRRLIKQGGVDINGKKHTDPDEEVLFNTNDILKIGKRSWFRIEIANINDLETERLLMKPMRVEDVDLIQKYLPEWEIVKYLSHPGLSLKAATDVAREVFRRVILQPDPKDEWIWKIQSKEEPEKIIGVAHLRRDSAQGSENIWLDPDYRTPELMEQALHAINEHAFTQLGFSDVVFKKAFAHAAAPQDLDALRRRFMSMDQTFRNRDTPEGIWGFTKEEWERQKEWWLKNRPGAALQTRAVNKRRKAQKLDAHLDAIEDIVEDALEERAEDKEAAVEQKRREREAAFELKKAEDQKAAEAKRDADAKLAIEAKAQAQQAKPAKPVKPRKLTTHPFLMGTRKPTPGKK